MNKMNARFWSTVCWLWLVLGAPQVMARSGPVGGISGRVVDRETRMPLAGVLVMVAGLEQKTLSDEHGAYTLSGVPVGTYTVIFQYPLSKPVPISEIIVKPDRMTVLTARIKVETEIREEVTVAAPALGGALDGEARTSTFGQDEVRRNPSSAGDVARMIATLPSVTTVNDQKNSLIVRGSSPNENLYVVDNIEVPAISHFPFQGTGGGALSLINVDFLDSLTFSPGGFPVSFGDCMSSVTRMQWREGSRDRFHTQLSLDMVGIGGVVEGPLFSQRASWMLSYRRSYADLLSKMMKSGVTPSWSDLQGKAAWDISDRHRLVLIGVSGWDESDFMRKDALETGQDYYGLSRDRSGTLGLNWFALWGEHAYSDTSVSCSSIRYRQDWDWTFDGSSAISNDSRDRVVHIRHQTTFTLPRGHRVRVGGQGQLLNGDYAYRSSASLDPLGSPLPEVNNTVAVAAQKVGFFADWSVPLPLHASLILGVRGDTFSMTKTWDWSPRISLNLPVSSRLVLDLYGGVYRQNLSLLLLTQHTDNRTMNAPVCRQLGGSLVWFLDDHSQLMMAIYGKSYRHLPVDPAQQHLCLLDEQVTQYRFGDQVLLGNGEGRAYGLELTWKRTFHKNFHALANVTLSRSGYRNAGGVWRNRISDRRYIVNLAGGYRAGRGWEFSGRWVIAGGIPYTPFDLEASTQANAGIYDQTRINKERLAPYHSLNVTVDKKLFFSHSSLTLNVSLWNVYGHENIANLFWNRVENRQDREKQWPFMPVLGVEYEF